MRPEITEQPPEFSDAFPDEKDEKGGEEFPPRDNAPHDATDVSNAASSEDGESTAAAPASHQLIGSRGSPAADDSDDAEKLRDHEPPRPAESTAFWRYRLICGLVFLGWAILLSRLIHIQGKQRQLMNDRVVKQSLFREVVPARPGEILDRSGQVLAMTVMRDSLYAIPEAIDDPWTFSWKISGTLGLNADEIYERLMENSDKQFVWIRRRIDEHQAEQIRSLDLPRRWWGLRREYLRQYPQGSYAAHVLGIRNIDNIGQGGLEQSLDDVIRGSDGQRVMTRDALGIVVEVAAERSRSPDHGQTVVSSIDLLTQIETERQLDALMEEWRPRGACAIVMEPHSGEILAIASRPGFDPNSLMNVSEAAWKNLAVSAVFEPGSTFKPMVVSWALQTGVLRNDDTIDCHHGIYRMGPRVLHDHHPYGDLSVEDVLVKSSNIGMARIAERIGPEGLYEAVRSFGFGRRTGIELPGEVPGLLRPLSQWNVYSLGSIPMGQELAVTPIQLITAHAALANGGQLVRPRVLRRNPGIDRLSTQPSGVQVVAPATDVGADLLAPDIAQWLVAGPLRQVVERGTGKSAQIPGLSVFGKTGTAQKLDPDTGTYSDTAWVLSFICGAPAEDPAVIVLLMVDEPTVPGVHYGGTVAAPTASRILKFAAARARALGLPESTAESTSRNTAAERLQRL